MNNGWKKIVIDGNADLQRFENCLMIVKEGISSRIPVNQISSVVIESQQITITSALMVLLTENNISIIFCDSKHNPLFETIPFSGNTYSSKRLCEQINWTAERKCELSCEILKLKILNQADLLKRIGNTDGNS